MNEPSLNPVHNGSQSDEQIMATGDCNTRLLYLYKINIYTHTHTKTPLLPTITSLFSPSCMILRGKKGKEREREK